MQKTGWFVVMWGHPSFPAMSPIDRAHTTSYYYSSLIETTRLLCTVYEIQPSIGPPSLYFATPLSPLAFNAPDGGVPWDDLRKILHVGHRMASVHNGEKNIAERFNPLSRVHQRYRQTDRRIGGSEDPNVTQSRSGKKRFNNASEMYCAKRLNERKRCLPTVPFISAHTTLCLEKQHSCCTL